MSCSDYFIGRLSSYYKSLVFIVEETPWLQEKYGKKSGGKTALSVSTVRDGSTSAHSLAQAKLGKVLSAQRFHSRLPDEEGGEFKVEDLKRGLSRKDLIRSKEGINRQVLDKSVSKSFPGFAHPEDQGRYPGDRGSYLTEKESYPGDRGSSPGKEGSSPLLRPGEFKREPFDKSGSYHSIDAYDQKEYSDGGSAYDTAEESGRSHTAIGKKRDPSAPHLKSEVSFKDEYASEHDVHSEASRSRNPYLSKEQLASSSFRGSPSAGRSAHDVTDESGPGEDFLEDDVRSKGSKSPYWSKEQLASSSPQGSRSGTRSAQGGIGDLESREGSAAFAGRGYDATTSLSSGSRIRDGRQKAQGTLAPGEEGSLYEGKEFAYRMNIGADADLESAATSRRGEPSRSRKGKGAEKRDESGEFGRAPGARMTETELRELEEACDFDNVCLCRMHCVIRGLRRHSFVRNTFASIILFAVGLKLCSELDAWRMPTRVV